VFLPHAELLIKKKINKDADAMVWISLPKLALSLIALSQAFLTRNWALWLHLPEGIKAII
jgi:hypothetical protein